MKVSRPEFLLIGGQTEAPELMIGESRCVLYPYQPGWKLVCKNPVLVSWNARYEAPPFEVWGDTIDDCIDGLSHYLEGFFQGRRHDAP